MTTLATRPSGAKARAAISAKTLRTDRWWLSPLIIAAILLFFIVYSTVRIFMAKWYFVEDYGYLTPLYSPCLSDSCVEGSSHFGTPLPKLPFFLPLGIVAFPIVAGFRVTCYYYRKSGYRSLWLSPQACAVTEPHKKYSGETRFPLLFMNLHRYFWYFALLVLAINAYDAILAFRGKDGGFGLGLGTIIIVINVAMLSLYTFSCHVCRHVMGGRLKHFSKHPVRYRFWTWVSKLNERHGTYAMISLFTVLLTDFYIMAVSAGWFPDLRFIG
ncbi:hypothetical protein [Catelliglobosispora koreensis]|uniref:hypothetical protein n=1 Tax=Catelliglobosispora koreensis TaxID=129052 RepID=UPI0003729FF6|nr:hypothetical protein [Catelliglobosispora koreensis]